MSEGQFGDLLRQLTVSVCMFVAFAWGAAVWFSKEGVRVSRRTLGLHAAFWVLLMVATAIGLETRRGEPPEGPVFLTLMVILTGSLLRDIWVQYRWRRGRR